MMSQHYNVGDIRADNIAIGNRAKAEYKACPDPKQASIQVEALQQIRQLIELLAAHADEIDNPREVQANAESVEIALRKKKLNRTRIENLIGRITPAVAGVTALANAIDAVHTAVSHL
jgi:hypothetical protein